jgi:hypothetical protein
MSQQTTHSTNSDHFSGYKLNINISRESQNISRESQLDINFTFGTEINETNLERCNDDNTNLSLISQTGNNEQSRKQEPQTAAKKSKKFSEYSNGDIAHAKIDDNVIDINNQTSNLKKFKKIIGSLSKSQIADFLQKTNKSFFLSTTQRRYKTNFNYDEDLDLYFRACSVKQMVEFFDHFFDATKIPFKMEFTKDNGEILYFYKNL